MKLLLLTLCITGKILFTNCRVLPNYLPSFCSQSIPNYGDCMIKTLNKLGPYLLKGVPEINFPRLNPLHIPLLVMNGTLWEGMSVSIEIKNAQIWGFDTTSIKSFKFNPKAKQGELHLHIPYLRAVMEFNLVGHFGSTRMEIQGFFKGTVDDINNQFKFTLGTSERQGVKYYTIDDFLAKSTIGDAHIKVTTKDPEFQLGADFLESYFNENPRHGLDANHDLYEETIEKFCRGLLEQVLASIPAEELIPESVSRLGGGGQTSPEASRLKHI